MSEHRIYTSNDGNGQPYEPASGGTGPFFQCDGTNDSPHFHVITGHPDMPDHEGLIVRQMHVPGYDQHDGNVKTNFSTMPPYHIVTGWHISNPEDGTHLAHLSATKKYSNTTDADEALNLWKEECTNTYGNGAFIKRVSANDPETHIYDFLPGHEQSEEHDGEQEEQPEQEEQEEQEQQEQPEQEDQEQEKQEQKTPIIKPGEISYSIAFYPPKQTGDKVRPAFSRTNIVEGHSNSSDAQNSLLNYADKLDMNKIMQDYRKQEENPDIWEDLFKNSKKNGWYSV